jgi:hypothetical protein
VYELTYVKPDGRDGRMLFARNVDPAEGDLAKADRRELTKALGTDRFRYLDRSAAGEAGSDIPLRDYWRWMLAAVLGLLAVETVLSRRFGHHVAPGQQGGAGQ